MKYKFRAECEHDYKEFKKLIQKEIVNEEITPLMAGFPDIVVEFDSSLVINELQNVLRKVEDGHVMLQTIALSENYTEKRNYD
jgi:hypothetical protein